MKRIFYRTTVFAAAFAVAVSCMVDTGTRNSRNKYNIIHYSEDIAGTEYVFRPAAAVAIALAAESYLSLDDEGRAEFDITSVFPEGIRHIDRNTINLENCANVYSYGKRFGETGAEWKVSLIRTGVPDAWLKYGYDGYKIRCTAPDTWTVVSRTYDGETAVYADGQIVVRYAGEGDGYQVFNVVSSGLMPEDGEYEAECRTGEAGVEVRRHTDLEIYGNYDAFCGYALRPSGGSFEVTVYAGSDVLDYCGITYTPDNVSYDVSIE